MAKAVHASKHHTAAAKHHQQAAHHHLEAVKHGAGGAHEKAAHHAHMAHGHGIHARKHAEEASLRHTEMHDDAFPWDEWVE